MSVATGQIFVMNSGSSSLKFGLFVEQDGDEHALIHGVADAIGKESGKLEIADASGKKLVEEAAHFATQKDALSSIEQKLKAFGYGQPAAIGHRVVHGGPHLVVHERITDEVLASLQEAVHFAPIHIPAAIDLIRHTEALFPQVPQFACFDTVFHQTMPESAYRFAIPEKYFAMGVRRYGFHGLSYASIVRALGQDVPGKMVVAHLGSGASVAAIAEGRSVYTSMGLTPTGGIPMGTRTGDLDPGVQIFLMRREKMGADELESLLNHEAGLTALAGTNDMRVLQKAAAAGEPKAQLAIEIFCQAIAMTVASYAVVLGGIDALVFTGGIGEHSAQVRDKVCGGLRLLGLELDAARNGASEPVVSAGGSTVSVRVIPAEEEKQIARECRGLLAGG